MADEQKPKIEGIYTALVNVRNTELSVYYARYNIQAVINLGLIAAVLATKQDSRFLTPLPCWIVLGGFALSVVWLCFTYWGKRLFTSRWGDYLRRYESDILAGQGLKTNLLMFTDVADAEKKLGWFRRNWANLTFLNISVPVIVFFAWVIIGYSAWFVEPMNSRISRLEAGVAALKESPSDSRDIINRLDVIDGDIREIVKRLPPVVQVPDERGQANPQTKPGEEAPRPER